MFTCVSFWDLQRYDVNASQPYIPSLILDFKRVHFLRFFRDKQLQVGLLMGYSYFEC